MRILLSQTHSLVSPRDAGSQAKPITLTRHFTVIEEGQRPPKAHYHPDESIPAIWRGVAAGGKDKGGIKIESKGRMPNDDHGRPSTLPGSVITPGDENG